MFGMLNGECNSPRGQGDHQCNMTFIGRISRRFCLCCGNILYPIDSHENVR